MPGAGAFQRARGHTGQPGRWLTLFSSLRIAWDKWAAASSPLDTLGTRYVGAWLAVLIDIAVLIDVIVSVSAFTATTARGIFALARHGFLPGLLARTTQFHSRPNTPLGGNLFVFICALLVTIFLALIRADPFVAFGTLVAGGTILITAIYFVLVLGAIAILREEPRKWGRWVIFAIALVAPLLGLCGSVVPFPQWPTSLGVYGSVAVLVLAALWTVAMYRWRPEAFKEAAKPHVWEEQPEETASSQQAAISST